MSGKFNPSARPPRYFQHCQEPYVFIGGTACSILFDCLGDTFRSTRDLDIVLIIELLDLTFSESLQRLLKDGAYERREKIEDKRNFIGSANQLNISLFWHHLSGESGHSSGARGHTFGQRGHLFGGRPSCILRVSFLK